MSGLSRRYVPPLSEEVLALVTRQSPWPHFVFDDFLPRRTFRQVRDEIISGTHRFKIKDGDPLKLRYCQLRQKDLIEAFLSLDFHNAIEQVTGEKLKFNSVNSIQLRLMDERSPAFPRHLDFFDDGRRSFIAIFYLTWRWLPRLGGELLLHKSNSSPEDCAVVIEPRPNRLMFFSTDHTNWHEVRRVVSGNRYSVLAEWLVE